jgi:uncharacterized damage-inducible protein DinB
MCAADMSAHFAYNRWANGRLLTSASQLQSDVLAKDLGTSYRSRYFDSLAERAGAAALDRTGL